MQPKPSKQHVVAGIKAERQRFASLLEPLTADELKRPSLCDRWTVEQVAGHVVASDQSVLAFFLGFTWAFLTRRVRQWQERAIARAAAKGKDAMLAQYRSVQVPPIAQLGSFGGVAVFGETIVHQEDIRRAIGKPRPEPPDPAVARQYAADRIRVNCICPGKVETNLMAEVRRVGVRRAPSVPIIVDGYDSRYAKPEEIAAMALNLACDDMSFVTGAVIPVDGGAMTR